MSSLAETNESKVLRTLRLRFAERGLAPTTGTPEVTGPALADTAPATSAGSVAEIQPEVLVVPHVPTGPTKVATGDLHPRHVDFGRIASTPNGQSVWRIIYGTELSGGLAGQTEDIEFQIMEPDGTGTIKSAGAFAGSLDGLEGGFVFKSKGVQNSDGSFVIDFVIVPGTGYGELAGLAGRYTVVATREHCRPDDTPDTCETLVSYTLTYRIPAEKEPARAYLEG